MGGLVEAVGVLMGAGVAAEFFMANGKDRNYRFTLRTEKGGLVVDKENTSGVYVLSTKHKTSFNFHNETTNPAVDVNVRMFEPHGCHFDLKPGNGCRSHVLTIEPTKKDTIRAEKQTNDGSCRFGAECDFNIQVKLATDPQYTDIDPKLQIEDGGLLPDSVRCLLAAVAAGLLIGPSVARYLDRRR